MGQTFSETRFKTHSENSIMRFALLIGFHLDVDDVFVGLVAIRPKHFITFTQNLVFFVRCIHSYFCTLNGYTDSAL